MPTREVCETARVFRLPILVDVVSRPEVVDMLAPQYPDVNFIIPHLGSFTDDWKAHQQVIYQIARYPNVYADTSAVRQFNYLVQAVQRAGARKLLFGSDGPWTHPGLELYKVRLLKLSPDHEAMVLGGNVLRLLLQTRPRRAAADVVRREEESGEAEVVSEPVVRASYAPEPDRLTASDLSEYRL
jgi:predicted TIM-barrel fold metal-dependent hydrolase